MFVRNRMTAHTISVQPHQSLSEAYRLMRERKFGGLPVVDGDRIVGVVTEWDVYQTAFERGGSAGIEQIPVSEAMVTDVVTVSQDEIIEEAAFLLHKHDIGVLPVVDGADNLVGIITESDLFGVFVEMLGLRERGSRVTLRIEDRTGVLAQITQTIRQCHVSIASIATFETENAPAYMDVVIRLKTTEPKAVVDALRSAGFRVMHVSQVWE